MQLAPYFISHEHSNLKCVLCIVNRQHVQIEIVHSWTSRCGSECFSYRRGRARNDLPWWLREIGAMTYNFNPLEWERVVTSDRRTWHFLKWQDIWMKITSPIIFGKIMFRFSSIFTDWSFCATRIDIYICLQYSVRHNNETWMKFDKRMYFKVLRIMSILKTVINRNRIKLILRWLCKITFVYLALNLN